MVSIKVRDVHTMDKGMSKSGGCFLEEIIAFTYEKNEGSLVDLGQSKKGSRKRPLK